MSDSESDNATDIKKRWFKVIYENMDGEIVEEGRFSGGMPRQAAYKAFSSILRRCREHGDDVDNAKFCIREITRKHVHKKYYYSGIRMELEEPLKVKTKKNKITFKFRNKVKPLRGDACTELIECLGGG